MKRNKTTRIIFHHSLGHDVPASEINKWHKDRGFACIGYHYVVRANGDIEHGRAIAEVGAHARGSNKDSIGVCLTGNFNTYLPLPAQIKGAKELYKQLIEKYGELKIEFHHELCPGILLNREAFVNELQS